jgi:RNase H-fold protein (predicted Holliday junction resolvase)
MTREEFEQVVAGVATTYASAKSATKKDVAGFATEMMQHWDKLEGSVAKKAKTTKKATKSVAKTAVKKTKAAPKKVVKK